MHFDKKIKKISNDWSNFEMACSEAFSLIEASISLCTKMYVGDVFADNLKALKIYVPGRSSDGAIGRFWTAKVYPRTDVEDCSAYFCGNTEKAPVVKLTMV